MSDAAPAAPASPAAPPAGAPAASAVPAAGKPGERMYEVKLPDGKVESWPESKIIERAQKSIGLEGRVSNAAKLEQAFSNFVSTANDPAQLVGLLNGQLKYDEEKQEGLLKAMLSTKSPRMVEAVKKWLYEHEIRPASLDPKDRELEELRAKDAENTRRAKEAEANQATEREKAEFQKNFNAYRVAIGDAVKAEGLPETYSNIARVARYAKIATDQKQTPNLVDCVKRVKDDLAKEFTERFEKATPENIVAMLPAAVLKKINEAYISTLKGKEEKIEGNEAPRISKSEQQKQKNKDFWKDLGRRPVEIP